MAVFLSSTVCALASLLALGLVCGGGMEEAPAPWSPLTLLALGLLASALFWSALAAWSGLRWRRKRPVAPPAWGKAVVVLIAAAHVLGLAFLVIG